MKSAAYSWRKWVEAWYLSYAVQGAVIAGLIPILLPLKVNNPTSIGLVMAAFSLGGFSAPFWGALADRHRIHRWLLTGGLIMMAAGLAGFPFTSHPMVWIVLALFIGFGAASAATVANLFIVEAHPKAEWDERIGWLQTFYGLGQVIGLLLAGLLSQISLSSGLIIAAGLCIMGGLFGWFTVKTVPPIAAIKPVLPHPARHGEWVVSSPQRLFHHLDLSVLRKLGPALSSPFGLFLIVWLVAIGGSAGFFSQYPLVMKNVFQIPPGFSSIAFAVVAGLGLALYSPAGNWSERRGPVRVMRIALGVRSLAYFGLFALGFFQFGLQNWLAIFAFAFVVCAWSIISVCGTTLAAQLSPVGEGEGLGIFNAMNALANVLGAAFGGWVAGMWGYKFLAAMGVGGVTLGLLLSSLITGALLKKKKP